MVKEALAIPGDNFVIQLRMLKRFLSILLFSVFAGTAFGVEDIYVTDTLKTLPGDMELRKLYRRFVIRKKGV